MRSLHFSHALSFCSKNEIKSSMHYARSLLPVFRVAAEWFSYRNCILTRRKYFVNNAVDDGRDADMDDVLAS